MSTRIYSKPLVIFGLAILFYYKEGIARTNFLKAYSESGVYRSNDKS